MGESWRSVSGSWPVPLPVPVLLTRKSGRDVLLDPLLNKGSGFSVAERERLKLRGLVPSSAFHNDDTALQAQSHKIMTVLDGMRDPLQQFAYLSGLQERNATLFHHTLLHNIERLAPIVYDPTIGKAISHWGVMFRRPVGMYFSADDAGAMLGMCYNVDADADVQLIVVSDGGRVLGLGDQGANGIAISVGKLALYTACAGIHPSKTLPCMLDVGTNNDKLRADDVGYLGQKHDRLTGDEYYAVADEFVTAITSRFPRAVLHFEDFTSDKAWGLLDKWRGRVRCFNDDIQGTGAIVLAGLINALRARYAHFDGVPTGDMWEKQRILIAGAGSAGIGIANAILYGAIKSGLSEAKARSLFWIADVDGLLGSGAGHVTGEQRPWVRANAAEGKGKSLLQLVQEVQPTILLGVTGNGGEGEVFDEQLVRSMADSEEHPVIFALSNPTERVEATAEQVYAWTDGRALYAAGVQFDPVEHNGRKLMPGQANNMCVYPAIGLAAYVCQAVTVTDDMLYAAAVAVSDCVDATRLKEGTLFPRLADIRSVVLQTAVAIINAAIDDGVARLPSHNQLTAAAIKQLVESNMWTPVYQPIMRQ